jgi:DNA-binding transcriptional ArsR family regulator
MDHELRIIAESQATVCSVFANPKRILILWALVDQEKSVSEIASIVGTSLQSTSQHLRLMRETGILASRRDGQTIYYFIAQNETAETCRLLIQSSPKGLRERNPV